MKYSYQCNFCEEHIESEDDKLKLCPKCGDDDLSELCPCCSDTIDPDTKVCMTCKETVK